MKKIKQTRPATWLAGGAVALSATAADAALVMVEIELSASLGTTADHFFSGAGVSFSMNVSYSGRSGIYNFGGARVGRALIGFDVVNYMLSTTRGEAGSVRGAGSSSLVGLLDISLLLVPGGGSSVNGWVVVTNDNESMGDIGVSHFIFDDENLTTPGSTATIADFANGTGYATVSSVSSVPEPSSLGLLALGAGGIMLRRNRKSVT